MHREVKGASDRRRSAAVRAHNSKTGVREINFECGDYVLRGILPRNRNSKLCLHWKGPFRVTSCESDFIFEIEDLLTGKKEFAHGRRLRFFRNKYFEVTEEVKEHLLYQEDELQVVESFDDIRSSNGRIEILVKWKGFSEDETDWVEIDILREDVPVLLREFIDDIRRTGTQRQKRTISQI